MALRLNTTNQMVREFARVLGKSWNDCTRENIQEGISESRTTAPSARERGVRNHGHSEVRDLRRERG
jgi:hypothetical protein